MQAIVFPSCSGTCVRRPLLCRLCSSQVACSLGHTDDMPPVGNNRCLELDSVVLQIDVSVVADAGSYGPDCSDEQRGRRLGYAFCVGPTGLGCVLMCFPPVPGAGPFLSCSTSSSTLFGSGGSSRSTRTPDVSAWCADTVTFLWFASKVHSCGLRLSRA